MKQLITVMACMMILLALLSQVVQNQAIFLRLEAGTYAVNSFCEKEDEKKLKDVLSGVMGCQKEEIVVVKESDVWKIKVPVKPILSTPSFWGISPEDNQGSYQWERERKDE